MRETSNVHLLSLAGQDAVMAIPAKTTLEKTTHFKRIESMVKRVKPALLVLDTLADVFGGDENNRVQARQFINLLRNVALLQDCAVLVLAHPSLTGMNSGSGLSGSTAWNASVRSRLYLERIVKDGREPDPDLRKLRTMKANYASTGGEVLLRWRRGVFQQSDARNASFAVLKDQQEVENLFMELLDVYHRAGRSVSDSPSSTYAPVVFANDQRANGTGKTAFHEAMDRLFKRGVIRAEESGPPSKRRKKIIRMADQGAGE
jgi:RecA-family ATPase